MPCASCYGLVDVLTKLFPGGIKFILLWQTPGNFTRQRGSYYNESVKLPIQDIIYSISNAKRDIKLTCRVTTASFHFCKLSFVERDGT